jgi:hypothetical protein
MGLILYKVEFALGMFDEAFHTAYLAFSKAENWTAKRRLCRPMKDAIEQSVSLRPPATVEILNVQERILDLFIRIDFPFQQSLDVLTAPMNSRAVALELLKLGHADLCVEVQKLTKIPLSEVMSALVRSFPSPVSDLAPFKRFPRMIEKCSPAAYRAVIVTYFAAVVAQGQLNDFTILKKLIAETVLDSFKGHMFCKFNFLEEAIAVAKKSRDKELIEAIRKKALGSGLAGLEKQMKALMS